MAQNLALALIRKLSKVVIMIKDVKYIPKQNYIINRIICV